MLGYALTLVAAAVVIVALMRWAAKSDWHAEDPGGFIDQGLEVDFNNE